MQKIRQTIISKEGLSPSITNVLAKSCLKIWVERYRYSYLKTTVEFDADELVELTKAIPKETREAWLNLVYPEWPNWLKDAALNL